MRKMIVFVFIILFLCLIFTHVKKIASTPKNVKVEEKVEPVTVPIKPVYLSKSESVLGAKNTLNNSTDLAPV